VIAKADRLVYIEDGRIIPGVRPEEHWSPVRQNGSGYAAVADTMKE
jgi:hypothetical protein